MSSEIPSAEGSLLGARISPPSNRWETISANFQRAFLKLAFRTLIRPPFGIRFQRIWTRLLSPLMPGVMGVRRRKFVANGVPAEMVTPISNTRSGVVLYLHGGAFCLGSPQSHRSITTRLAAYSRLSICVPDYRLAPEHPSPAALHDAIKCYDFLVSSGFSSSQIVIGGDSAGGALAISLALALRDRGDATPAGLMLISPVTDPSISGDSIQKNSSLDPMVNESWIRQGLEFYGASSNDPVSNPLNANLAGLPPTLIQVGEQEILLSDSTRFVERAVSHGVKCDLEVHAQRWHVFHLQALYLLSARNALHKLADYAAQCIDANAL